MNTLVKCSLSAAILFVLPSCSLFDDEFTDPGSDEYSESFASTEWNELTPNLIPVMIEYPEIKDRLFPDEAILYYHNDGETADICFENVIKQAKEYPDITGFDGYGHIVALAIESIPVKVSDNGKIKFSRKTQTATLAVARWGGCVVNYYNIINCKVSISGEMKPFKTDKTIYGHSLGDIPANLSGDILIKIITPDNSRLCLRYKTLAQTDGGSFLFH